MAPIKQNLDKLEQLSKLKSRKKSFIKFITQTDDSVIDAISEILLNAIEPSNKLKITTRQLNSLKKHAPTIREIAKEGTPVKDRRQALLNQSGGSFVPLLVSLALPILQHVFSK